MTRRRYDWSHPKPRRFPIVERQVAQRVGGDTETESLRAGRSRRGVGRRSGAADRTEKREGKRAESGGAEDFATGNHIRVGHRGINFLAGDATRGKADGGSPERIEKANSRTVSDWDNLVA